MHVQEVADALRDILDPDVGVNIVDLGLVEHIDVTGDRLSVGLIMTSPACPQGDWIAEQAERRLAALAPAMTVDVRCLELPLWAPDRMSDAARQQLGWDA